MHLKEFLTPRTINIFCDASVSNWGTCYGAIVVRDHDVIDETYRICTGGSNNNGEIKAIRAGVRLALKYRDIYPDINLFSDSQVSVLGIRDRFINWKINGQGELIGTQGTPIMSQEVYVEVADTIVRNNLRIKIWHQKGHVNTHLKSLFDAQHVFRSSNMVRDDKIDLNLIRYISLYNNVVDQTSRSRLNTADRSKEYFDPIIYQPNREFDKDKYKSLIAGNKGVF